MKERVKRKRARMTAIDLFSGGGGLTVGLKRAGFKVVGAVELEPNAAATYKANHRKTKVLVKDIRKVSGDELKRLSPTREIDLLAGCPPCQGFSSLTYKYKNEDPRNELIREFARLVLEVQPRAIMMENVPGLSKRGKGLFNEFVDFIVNLGYVPKYEVLQVADYGVPQSRRRLVLLAGLGFSIELPKPTHSRTGKGKLKTWETVRNAIAGMSRPLQLDKTRNEGGPVAFNWHVVRTLAPQNIERLRVAKAGATWVKIPKRLRPDCHKDIEAGFPNVYGRMPWNAPSPTITGGCTTLSKGRFGHPANLRTISVREAAILQTFPLNYKIKTEHMDHACNIVGNALPCDFATVVSRQCAIALRAR